MEEKSLLAFCKYKSKGTLVHSVGTTLYCEFISWEDWHCFWFSCRRGQTWSYQAALLWRVTTNDRSLTRYGRRLTSTYNGQTSTDNYDFFCLKYYIFLGGLVKVYFVILHACRPRRAWPLLPLILCLVPHWKVSHRLKDFQMEVPFSKWKRPCPFDMHVQRWNSRPDTSGRPCHDDSLPPPPPSQFNLTLEE